MRLVEARSALARWLWRCALLGFQHRNDIFHGPYATCNTCFHGWSYSQSHMNANEVIEHDMQSHRSAMIAQLLTVRVRLSRVPAVAHAHSEVQSFAERGRHMARIWFAGYSGFPRSEISVSLVSVRSAIELDKLRVVDIAAERTVYRFEVWPVAIRRKLDSVRETACNVVHKLHCAARVAISDKPRNNQFRIGVNSEPQPYITESKFLPSLVCVFRFAVDERPELIGLYPTARQTSERSIKELLAHVADFNEQAEDRSLGKSS